MLVGCDETGIDLSQSPRVIAASETILPQDKAMT